MTEDKFNCLVRYMVLAARAKRCVPYYEVENLLGLSHNRVAEYADTLGNFCKTQRWPLLNSLLISSVKCRPSIGFFRYIHNNDIKLWGKYVTGCWKYFHVSSPRGKQVHNVSGLNRVINRRWFGLTHNNI